MVVFSEAGLEAVGIETAVSNQEKIQYLKRFLTLDREIDRKLKEVEHWRARLGRVTAIYSFEPKGGGSIQGKTENAIVKIVDLENEINADIDRLIEIRGDIKAVIEAVEDDRELILLQYRYIDGKTFEWIAEQMNYSSRQAHRLHSQSLANLKIKDVIECHT